MKRLFNYMFLMMAAATLALTGCQKEEIVFDNELPQFEIQADAILLEVIAPTGTSSDEVLYITGPALDGEKLRLTKAEKESVMKWGVYLFAEDFAEGKSLKDGFYFYSETNREERSAVGDSVMHKLDVAYGTRTNVWVNSWAKFFDGGDKPIEHDGYAVFFIDETGWDAITLYAWGSAEAFGGWPGAAPMGRETINGVEFQYIDFGAGNEDADLNLIFNNNNGGTQLGDYNFIVKSNLYVKVTADGVEAFDPFSADLWPNYAHDGDGIYICNKAGWDECALYAWGDGIDELFGGWPGTAPSHSFEYKNNTWYFFECGASNAGLFYNFIANNNNNGKQVEPLCAYELGTDGVKYIVIYEDLSCEEVANYDDVPAGEQKPDPDPTPGGTDTIYVTVKDTISTHLYFVDKSTIKMHYLYAWGSGELFGGWPGVKWTTWENVTFLGQNFHHYEIVAEYGSEYNLIINNKGYTELTEAEQKQYDACTVKVGTKTDLFYTIHDTKVEEMTPTVEQAKAIRRMFQK